MRNTQVHNNEDLLKLWSDNLNTGHLEGTVEDGFKCLTVDGIEPDQDDIEMVNAVNGIMAFSDDRQKAFDDFRFGRVVIYDFDREDIAATEGRLARSLYFGSGIHPADRF